LKKDFRDNSIYVTSDCKKISKIKVFTSLPIAGGMPSTVPAFQPLTGPCHCGLEEVCSNLNLTMEQLEGNKTIHLPGNITLNQVQKPKTSPWNRGRGTRPFACLEISLLIRYRTLNLTLDQVKGNKTIRLPGNITLNQIQKPKTSPWTRWRGTRPFTFLEISLLIRYRTLNLTLGQVEGNKTIHLPGNITLNQVQNP
jgi:hypothetical protein